MSEHPRWRTLRIAPWGPSRTQRRDSYRCDPGCRKGRPVATCRTIRGQSHRYRGRGGAFRRRHNRSDAHGCIADRRQAAGAFVPSGRATGSDAVVEADATMGRLYRLVIQRAASAVESQRVVTRSDVLEMFGLTENDLGGRWDEPELQTTSSRSARTSLNRRSTLTSGARQRLSNEPSASTKREAPGLSKLLETHDHVLLSGQSGGSGKSTAAMTLRILAAHAGVPLSVEQRSLHTGPLGLSGVQRAISCDGLSTPLPVGRGVLTDPSAVVVFDGVSEMPVPQRAALASELSPRMPLTHRAA